jgi:hypothetical protein
MLSITDSTNYMYFFEGRGHIVLVAANKPTDTQRPPPRRRAERSHVLSETGSPSLKPPPCAAMNPRPPSPSPLPRSVSPLATFRWFWCRSAAGRGETRLATYSSATYCISVSRGQRRVARASGGRGRGSGEQSMHRRASGGPALHSGHRSTSPSTPPAPNPATTPAAAGSSRAARSGVRVRSHCRFRNRGIEYVSESGVKWMSGSTKRQCDQTLPEVPSGRPPAARAAPPVAAGRPPPTGHRWGSRRVSGRDQLVLGSVGSLDQLDQLDLGFGSWIFGSVGSLVQLDQLDRSVGSVGSAPR